MYVLLLEMTALLRHGWWQAFHNYDMTCDIFNHSNLIYWQISLPGLDGWNNVSCTGTNFVVRARAAQEVCPAAAVADSLLYSSLHSMWPCAAASQAPLLSAYLAEPTSMRTEQQGQQ